MKQSTKIEAKTNEHCFTVQKYDLSSSNVIYRALRTKECSIEYNERLNRRFERLCRLKIFARNTSVRLNEGGTKRFKLIFQKAIVTRGVINYGISVDLPRGERRGSKMRTMNKYRASRSRKTRLKTLLFPSK